MINLSEISAFFQSLIRELSTQGAGAAIRSIANRLESPYKDILDDCATYYDDTIAKITKENIINFFFNLQFKQILQDTTTTIFAIIDATIRSIPVLFFLALEQIKKTIKAILSDPRKLVTALAIIGSVIATVTFLVIAASYGFSIYQFYSSCCDYVFKFNGNFADSFNNGVFGYSMFFRSVTLSYLIKSLPFIAAGVTLFSSAFFVKQKDDTISIEQRASFSEDPSVNTLKNDEAWSHIPTSTYLAAKLLQKPIDRTPMEVLNEENEYSFSFEQLLTHSLVPPIHAVGEMPSLLAHHASNRIKNILSLGIFVVFKAPQHLISSIYQSGLDLYASIEDKKQLILASDPVKQFHQRNQDMINVEIAMKARTLKPYKNPFGRANTLGKVLYAIYPFYWTITRLSLNMVLAGENYTTMISHRMSSIWTLTKALITDGVQVGWSYTTESFKKAPTAFSHGLESGWVFLQNLYHNSVDFIVHNIHEIQKDIGILCLLASAPFVAIALISAVPAIVGAIIGNIMIAIMFFTKASVYADAFLVVCSLFLSLYTTSVGLAFSNDFMNQIVITQDHSPLKSDTLASQYLNSLDYDHVQQTPSSVLFSRVLPQSTAPAFISANPNDITDTERPNPSSFDSGAIQRDAVRAVEELKTLKTSELLFRGLGLSKESSTRKGLEYFFKLTPSASTSASKLA